MTRTRTVLVAVVHRAPLAAVVLLASCRAAPPLDPFVLHVTAVGAFVPAPSGSVRATEDVNEGFLEGDDVTFDGDLDQSGASGGGVHVELRPLRDTELYASFLDVRGHDGDARLPRDRRFDGEVFARGERVRSELEWRRYSIGGARRVLSARGSERLALDVLARIGVNRYDVETELVGESAEERRQLRAGAPTAGLELRAPFASRGLLWSGVDGGYWNHDGSRVGLLELRVGCRFLAIAPFHVELEYGLSVIDGTARFEDRELTSVRLLSQILTCGVGVAF